ncbi:uncharacterized protein LOC121629552 [Melanotaenia boesemani]|uniref:uncharacterized protein LOC121629552 n=1 Tax=Melanotaenia boesemani TaxID=1250792 RepID=UPI001C03AAC2|nr:uncharacterized protein LOC121629552 [Melanotaenia boesemani]
MKLELLLALAVVALVPSLSESRIVSKCELKGDLEKAIVLDKRLVPYKEQILAIVICEVEGKSHFVTDLTKVYGERRPTTTVPSTADNITIVEIPTTTTTTANPVNTNSGTASNSAAGGSRKKRDARKKTKKKSSHEESLADIMNDEENKFNEVEMMQDDEHMGDHKDSSHEVSAIESWSLGFYGVFQLSDSHFCNSGYRWSRNLCRSSCSAFTDDDITDDVACFARTGYWRHLLRSASKQCHGAAKTYLAECAV